MIRSYSKSDILVVKGPIDPGARERELGSRVRYSGWRVKFVDDICRYQLWISKFEGPRSSDVQGL